MIGRVSILVLSLAFVLGCSGASKTERSTKADKAFDELEAKEKSSAQEPVTEEELEKELRSGESSEELHQQLDTEVDAQKMEPKNLPLVKHGVLHFEETGIGTASKYEPQIKAEHRAEKDAIRKAFDSSGADFFYAFSDHLAQVGPNAYETVQQYLLTLQRGVAQWERVGQPVYEPLSDGTVRCEVSVRGTITTRGRPDATYKIKIMGLGLEHVYQVGERISVRFKLTHSSYVHVFSVTEEGKVYALVPSAQMRDHFFQAGEVVTIPGEGIGRSIRAWLPEDQDESIEVLHIVATRDQPMFTADEWEAKNVGGIIIMDAGDFGKFIGRLAGLERSVWTMAVLPYTIYR